MVYLTKMNGESGQNSFSAVGFSILGQPHRQTNRLQPFLYALSDLLINELEVALEHFLTLLLYV